VIASGSNIFSIRTEHAYVDWIKRFIYFHGKRADKFPASRIADAQENVH
jgi:hypothetical protein